jgi:hypothetical protein
MVAEAAARRAGRVGRSYLRRIVIALSVVVAGLGLAARRADSHPLLTTLSQVSAAPDGAVEIVVRAFVDDFAAAVSGRAPAPAHATPTPADSATARYLSGALVLTDAAGRRVSLRVVAVRRTDDLIWVTLRAPAVAGGKGARLTNRVLFERYDDQVNIVQTSVGGRRQTLLFTKRDGAAAKAI